MGFVKIGQWRLSGFFLALLFVAMPAQIVYAQPYLTHNYAIEEGLIQSQAAALHQDNNGYLWIGTHGGISRFDGLNFTHFTIDNGLISNRTQALQEDDQGNLWAGSTNGITIFTKSGLKYLTVEDGLLDNNINDLFLAHDGTMWVASQSGLTKYNGTTFEHFSTDQGLVHPVINSIAAGFNDDLWVATNGGLCKFENEQFMCYTVDDGLPSAVVTNLLIDKKRRIWAATPAGIAFLSTDGLSRFIPQTDLALQQVNSIIEDSKGAIWIGTSQGVARLDSHGKLTHTWLDGNWIVRPLLEDSEQNIWAGTSGRGVVKFQRTAFSHMNPTFDLPKDVYLEVFEDSQDRIWAGAMTHGLYRIDSTGVRHFAPDEYPDVLHIRSIEEDKEGILWIGTGSGVRRFDGKTFKSYSTNEGLSNAYVYAVLPDRQNRIWIGTLDGLNILEGDSIKTIDLEIGANQQTVFSFHQSSDARMWIGTAQGLLYHEDDQLHKVSSLVNKPVSSILLDNNGDFWVGTLGFGAYRINPQSGEILDTLNVSHGLNSSTVYFIQFDGDGDLWIGTSKGINQVDMEAYWMEDSKQIRAFGKDDGIVGVETNTGAVTVDNRGRLWFGTIDALIHYDASSRPKNDAAPPIHLADVKLFLGTTSISEFQEQLDVQQTKRLTFPYDKNHLTFDFLGLSYTRPELVTYKYRLSGFDANWQPPTLSRFVTYANLPPGNYSFEVSALNSDGIPSEEPASLSFAITPPFWRTPWFIGLSLIIVILGIVGLIQLRTQSLNRRRIALEETVETRTEDLRKTHAELLETREAALQAAKSKSAFMSAMTHELHTPMNGILGMTQVLTASNMDEDQLDCAQTIMECGTMMMELIENLLTFADLAAGRRTLTIKRFKLPDLLSETILHIRSQGKAKELEIRFFLSQAVPHEIEADREHTRQILQHLLSNAIKFTQAGIVYIEVQLEQNQSNNTSPNLLFSVHDTGIGMEKHQLKQVFEAFSQADMSTTRKFQGAGIGLALVHQLTMLMGGKLVAKSWPGIGSSFYFSLPLQEELIPELQSEAPPSPLSGKRIRIEIEDKRERRRLSLLSRYLGMVVDEGKPTQQSRTDIVIADPTRASKAAFYKDASLVMLQDSGTMTSAGAVLHPEAPGTEVEQILRSVVKRKMVAG